jgi:hypothetical protein
MRNNRCVFVWLLPVLAVVFLSACTRPAQYSAVPLRPYDANTRYAVEERENGFVLVVEFRQRAFVPRSDAEMHEACISALTSIAADEADKQGRRLQPLDPATVRVSTGRDGVSGHSSCSARARFYYIEPQFSNRLLPSYLYEGGDISV